MDTTNEYKMELRELTEEHQVDLKEAFLLLQNPNTETVPNKKLELLLRLAGLNPRREVLSEMKLGDNLTYEEVLTGARRVYRTEPTFEDLMQVARALAKDGGDYLSLAEVRQLVFNSGEIMCEIDLEDILAACGGAHDGKVKIEDFVRAAYNF